MTPQKIPVETPAKILRDLMLVPNGKETDGTIHYDELRPITDADIVWFVDYLKNPTVEAILGTDTVQKAIEKLDKKNDQQDDRMTAIEAKNVEQDNRLTNIEAKDREQDGRLSNIETKNTQQDNRLSSIETKNTQQDTAISAAQNAANAAQRAADAAQDAADNAQDTADNAGDVVAFSTGNSGGYIKLKNGVIIQWGFASVSSNWDTFPLNISFSSRDSYALTIADSGAESGNVLTVIGIDRISGSQFKAKGYSVIEAGPWGAAACWIAVGY